MRTSSRVKEVSDSITLKLNSLAVEMAESGRKVYNYTAGQLPFRPMQEFVDFIRSELDFLKSYQYSPVAGFPELRKRILAYFEESRGVSFASSGAEFDCVITNGGKHAVSNVLGALIDHGDEVILLSPYWLSYPEIVKFCKGVPITISSSVYENFVPHIQDIKKALSPRTRAIILNSPNNPSGTHYPEHWMREFADLMAEHPEVAIISDEIYFELSYFDPKPSYPYQYRPELLKQTVIVDGISKSLASTGLRIGWALAPKPLAQAMTRLQAQTTSGANSLAQRALTHVDFNSIGNYLVPVRKHLRDNANTLRELMQKHELTQAWYQPLSAFYFMLDFSHSPMFAAYTKGSNDQSDYSAQICEDLLSELGVALVPGGPFGQPNTGRISLVLDKGPFAEGLEILFARMNKS
jgi:aspartate aminotransferase